MKSSRSGERWELSRWLTEAVTLDSLGWLDSRGYPAVLVALTDQPPFPVAVRGVRQDWRHVVVVPLPGPKPPQTSFRGYFGDLTFSGRLLAADVMPRESKDDSGTLLGFGATHFELQFDAPRDKERKLIVNAQFSERNGAHEWSLFDWRTGKWSSGRKQNSYAQMSLDHLHPTLGIVRVRFVVKKGNRAKPQLSLRGFYVHVENQ